MDEAFKKLIERLDEEAKASADDSDAFSQLREYVEKTPPPLEELLEALREGRHARVKCALLQGSGKREEPGLIELVRGLVRSDSSQIRAALCQGAAVTGAWLGDDDLLKLLGDEDEEVRQRATEASAGRAGLVSAVMERLKDDGSWRVRQDAAEALAGEIRAFEALISQLCEDSDSDVRRACAGSLEAICRRAEAEGKELGGPSLAEMRSALEALENLGKRSFRGVGKWLEERLARSVDLDKLRNFGRILTTPEEMKRLPRAYGVERVCETIVKLLLGEAPRAVVVLGEAGAGKTAVVYEVIRQLAARPDGGWHALALSPSDFLTGTRYLGEWESRLDDIIKNIKAPRRVLLYIPGLAQLSQVGTTGKSDANVASMLAPYIERGEVTVLGESGVDEFRGGLGAAGSLRRIFTAVEVQPTTAPQTRQVLQSICAEHDVTPPEGLLDRLMELVGFYVTRASEPGRSAGVLRRMLGEGRASPLSERDILAQLSSSTGIPSSILDDAVPLDRGKTREFFESRVMGQPEAVGALVDLMTLVKAGLNDPDKPMGVFLFVGPTGVGKTELARALAELLFGDRERLVRVDMSEYATFDAFERLIGRGTMPGRLTESVREHPFSVVLLDEIEKAHVNVFDLCLQIFDAGRLTDANGRTCDFRRTIIILTSNVGSRIEREGPVGFGRATGPQVPERERVSRELERVFRPEFLNRIDRVVIFRPLDAETAARIARREVAHVLSRGGVTRRRLAVDVDESVFSLLLREGYSLTFGARPLKRTVERLVLVPLAELIAAGKVPPGSLLRLVARSNRVEADVTPPENDFDVLSKRPLPEPPPAAGSGRVGGEARVRRRGRIEALDAEISALRKVAEPLVSRKASLLAESKELGFRRADARKIGSVLDEIYRLDGLLARLHAADEAVASARDADDEADEPLDAIAWQVSALGAMLRASSPDALADALVSLTLVSSQGELLDGVAALTRMYEAFARRERLDVEAIDERRGGSPSEEAVTLLISGAGAWSLLAPESGLHLLSKGRNDGEKKVSQGGEPRGLKTRAGKPLTGREVVRVEVAPVPRNQPPFSREDVRIELKPIEGKLGRFLAEPRWDAHLVHLPSMRSLHAWLGGPQAQAMEHAMLLLRAKINAPREAEQGALVRRYTLGPVERVRDLRSNRTSARLDRVLDGELQILRGAAG